MKCNLTDKLIRDFKLSPTARRAELCDQRLKGHYAEIRATSPGEASFYLRYKDDTGKTCHQKLGTTDEVDVAESRKRARKLKAEIHLGRNPRAEAMQQKQVMTWNEYMDTMYIPHVKVRKRSWKNDEAIHRLYLKERIGHLRLDQISRHSLQQLHTELGNSDLSPASADHVLKMARQALNLACTWNLLEKNPIAKIELYNQDNQVENYLEGESLKCLLHAIASEKDRTVADIVLLLLATGLRVNEVLSATWSDFDLGKDPVLRLKAASSKSKKRRTVHLNPVAVGILQRQPSKRKSPYVFPSKRGGSRKTITKRWAEIRQRAGLPKLRLHDLRHSYASFLANSGCNEYQIQHALGHASPATSRRYVHLNKETMQKASNAASDRITAALNDRS